MRTEAEKIGVTLSPCELHKFFVYKNMLQEHNSRYNLTSLISDEDILYKHFIDSLSIAKYLKKRNGICIDIGTGAGFPLLPAGIARSDLRITLADSVKKKARFLETLTEELGIANIVIIHARAEDLARDPQHRAGYDYAVSRAVAPLRILVEYCVPFLRTGGMMLAMKASLRDEPEKARNSLKELKAECINIDRYEMVYDNETYKRTVVEIVKKEDTATKYPRKAGIPEKHPL